MEKMEKYFDQFETKEEKNNRRSGIFFGIIGVATLIIAIIGTTLAYFSIGANSEAGVDAQAALVNIIYTDGSNISITDLIPATESVARAGYGKASGQCIDDNGRTVCGTYQFSIENGGTDSISITGVLTVTLNEAAGENYTGFSNLSYIVYDVTDSANPSVVKNTTLFPTTVGDTASIFGSNLNTTVTIDGQETKQYEMLIWLNEAGANNDVEQGAHFTASVSVKAYGSNDGRITGEISGA